MKPALDTRASANDEARRATRRGPEPLGPLWLITIGMGAFFAVAALVMAVG